MQIAGSWDAQPGQETWLAFNVGEQTVEARGVVVWSSRTGTGEGFRWGIRFTALHEQTADLISHYVDQACEEPDEYEPEYQAAYQQDTEPTYDDDEPPTQRWARPREDETAPNDVPDLSAEIDDDEDDVPVVSGNTQVVSIDDIIARGGAPGEEVHVEEPTDTDGVALPVVELPKDLLPIEAWPDSVPSRSVPPREPIPDHSGPLPVGVPGSLDHSGPLPLSVPFGSSNYGPAREDSVHAPLIEEYRAPLAGQPSGPAMTVPMDLRELQSIAAQAEAARGSTEVPPPPAVDAWQTSSPGAPPWQHEPAGFVPPPMQAQSDAPAPYLIDLPDSYVGPMPSEVAPHASMSAEEHERSVQPTAVTHALPPREPTTGVTDVAAVPAMPPEDAGTTAVTNALPSPEPPTGVTNALPQRPRQPDVSLTAVTNAVPDGRRSRRHRRKRPDPAPELPMHIEPEPELESAGPDPISAGAFESPEDRRKKIEAILATAKRRSPDEADDADLDATKVGKSAASKKSTTKPPVEKAKRTSAEYDTQQRRQRRELQELFRAALDELRDGP